jgi:ribosomal protein S27AE
MSFAVENDAPVSADHARCARCGVVVHLLFMTHHDRECPRVTPPGSTEEATP